MYATASNIMAKTIDIEVEFIDNQWIVRRETSYRPISVHSTQRDAIEAGRKIARTKRCELVIRGLNGRVRKRVSYTVGRPNPQSPEVLFPPGRGSRSRKAVMAAVLKAMSELERSSKNRGRTASTIK